MNDLDDFNYTLDDMGADDSQLSPAIKSYLIETGKWAKFLGILGFVAAGFVLIAAIFMGSFMSTVSRVGGIGSFTIYLFMAALYFFPSLHSFKFGQKVQRGIKTNDQQTLEEAFKSLRNRYLFVGVIALIITVVYGAILLFTLISGAMML